MLLWRLQTQLFPAFPPAICCTKVDHWIGQWSVESVGSVKSQWKQQTHIVILTLIEHFNLSSNIKLQRDELRYHAILTGIQNAIFIRPYLTLGIDVMHQYQATACEQRDNHYV